MTNGQGDGCKVGSSTSCTQRRCSWRLLWWATFAALPLALAACGTQTTVSPTVYTQVSAGGSHTCAVVSDSTVQCWGDNSTGQLGDGSKTGSSVPVTVMGLTGVTAVSAGHGHTCALLHGGTVKCWGRNSAGQLGDGSKTGSSIPVAVTSLTGATAVSAGNGHTCALLGGGRVKCWGANGLGQLGNDSKTGSSTPVEITNLAGVTAISTGDGHTCALLRSGTVQCWGGNSFGELGNDTIPTYGLGDSSPTPVTVQGVTNATAISGVNSHTCALLSDGRVMCWGDNAFGKVGIRTRDRSTPPVIVPGVTGVTAVSAGYRQTCALLRGGAVQCWGDNSYGQMGNGTKTGWDSPPLTATGLTSVTAISDTCALLASGTIKCWGENRYGQLGNGSKIGSSIPVAVAPPRSCLLGCQPVTPTAPDDVWEVFNPEGGCTPLNAFYNLKTIKPMGLKNERTPQEIFNSAKPKIPDLEMMSFIDYIKNIQQKDIDEKSLPDWMNGKDQIVIISKTNPFGMILFRKSMCDKLRGNE